MAARTKSELGGSPSILGTIIKYDSLPQVFPEENLERISPDWYSKKYANSN